MIQFLSPHVLSEHFGKSPPSLPHHEFHFDFMKVNYSHKEVKLVSWPLYLAIVTKNVSGGHTFEPGLPVFKVSCWHQSQATQARRPACECPWCLVLIGCVYLVVAGQIKEGLRRQASIYSRWTLRTAMERGRGREREGERERGMDR